MGSIVLTFSSVLDRFNPLVLVVFYLLILFSASFDSWNVRNEALRKIPFQGLFCVCAVPVVVFSLLYSESSNSAAGMVNVKLSAQSINE